MRINAFPQWPSVNYFSGSNLNVLRTNSSTEKILFAASNADNKHFQNYREEIKIQPDIWEKSTTSASVSNLKTFSAALSEASKKYNSIRAMGIGSSNNALLMAQRRFKEKTGKRLVIQSPLEFLWEQAHSIKPDTSPILLVSQSGNSDLIETVIKAVSKLPDEQKPKLFAISNEVNSILGKGVGAIEGDYEPGSEIDESVFLGLNAPKEKVIPASVTTSTTALKLMQLSDAMGNPNAGGILPTSFNIPKYQPDIRNFANIILKTALNETKEESIKERIPFVLLSTQAMLPTLQEAELKLIETSPNSVAGPYEMSDFEHGPKAIIADRVTMQKVDPTTQKNVQDPVETPITLYVVPPMPSKEERDEYWEKVREHFGYDDKPDVPADERPAPFAMDKAFFITDDNITMPNDLAEHVNNKAHILKIPMGKNPQEHSLRTLVTFQLLSLYLAKGRGLEYPGDKAVLEKEVTSKKPPTTIAFA